MPPPLSWEGDLRAGYFALRRDDRDGTAAGIDAIRARARLGLGARPGESLRAKGRVAGRWSTRDNRNSFQFFTSAPSPDGLRAGDATVDELYLEWTPIPAWAFMTGRFQTSFALVDVAGRSLDREDSNNTDITWTDGAQFIHRSPGDWHSHLVLQRNLSSGPTNVLRYPLSFQNPDSRVLAFLIFENRTPVGPVIQRGLSFSWIPKALQKDGDADGRIDDYRTAVIRLAAAWPIGPGGMRFLLGGEAGYAPVTPTRAAMQTGVSGDTDGGAWQASINLMEFREAHSVGLSYGRAGAGWLLSPDLRNNHALAEARYQWRMDRSRSIEVRLRERHEIILLVDAEEKRVDRDFFIRYTQRFRH